ncbi:DUF2589 domain-containing protein [Coleofasciculus sp.]|uniref:DUF2589 domain-containing protein n=1 Tax=Coleofasciculus sp. TaxID=3100458 RepID=UPI0039F9F6D9
MSDEGKEQDLLEFRYLLGAPLAALIEAERQAAIATTEFIKEIGFQPVSSGQEKSQLPANASTPSAEQSIKELGFNFGNLRMITFLYSSRDDKGVQKINTIQIPLLSLIPIPMLQIKQANFEFYAEISEIRPGEILKSDDQGNPTPIPLEPQPVTLMTKMGIAPREKVRHRYQRRNMKVNLTVERSDMPSGLLQLHNLMPQMIQVSSGQDIQDKQE